MSDDGQPELNFDPLDDTKLWPRDKFPLQPVGRIVLDRNPENVFAETEQSAFCPGVLVDGIDFSDDKMLQGRTLSYSDTQRYRVGPNYLRLPINAPKALARTNQCDGQMAFYADGGENKHVNYEPSSMGGQREAPKPMHEYRQYVEGHLGRYQTSWTADDYKQAGECYRTFKDWEREDLINNLATGLKQCPTHIQLRMVWHFWHCDEDYGTRVAHGIGVALEHAMRLPPFEGKPAPLQKRPGPG